MFTDGTCAVALPEGRRYLLYLKRVSAGAYGTTRCSGTMPVESSKKALRWLRQHGQPPRR